MAKAHPVEAQPYFPAQRRAPIPSAPAERLLVGEAVVVLRLGPQAARGVVFGAAVIASWAAWP